jgi:hypothetical protein
MIVQLICGQLDAFSENYYIWLGLFVLKDREELLYFQVKNVSHYLRAKSLFNLLLLQERNRKKST